MHSRLLHEAVAPVLDIASLFLWCILFTSATSKDCTVKSVALRNVLAREKRDSQTSKA